MNLGESIITEHESILGITEKNYHQNMQRHLQSNTINYPELNEKPFSVHGMVNPTLEDKRT